MVRFCQRCGTGDADDGAVFCRKCGNRFPPPRTEPAEMACPRCGASIPDRQAVFCDRCGSPLHAAPPAPVRQAGAQPAAAPAVPTGRRCPSCGAPFVDEVSDYCNKCGASFYGPAPSGTAGEPRQPASGETGAGPLPPSGITGQPSPEKTGAAGPVAAGADAARGPPSGKKPLRKYALIAGMAVIVLVVLAVFISGMVPETGQPADATPAPTLHGRTPVTTPVALETTKTTAPLTPPATMPPSPAATTKASPTPAKNASAAVTTNGSANMTTNASAPVPTTIAVTDPSVRLSVGQSAWDGKGRLTVHDLSFKDKMSDPVPSYAIGKKYLIINITYENLQQNATMDADLSMMRVTDGGGFPYETVSDVLLENPWTGTAILPGEKRTGNLLFLVPPEALFLKLEYRCGGQLRAVFQLT